MDGCLRPGGNAGGRHRQAGRRAARPLATDEVRKALANFAIDAMPTSPQEAKDFLAAEYRRWGEGGAALRHPDLAAGPYTTGGATACRNF